MKSFNHEHKRLNIFPPSDVAARPPTAYFPPAVGAFLHAAAEGVRASAGVSGRLSPLNLQSEAWTPAAEAPRVLYLRAGSRLETQSGCGELRSRTTLSGTCRR